MGNLKNTAQKNLKNHQSKSELIIRKNKNRERERERESVCVCVLMVFVWKKYGMNGINDIKFIQNKRGEKKSQNTKKEMIKEV